jgi:cell fate regulator YaaT (PSP1 superfamily)
MNYEIDAEIDVIEFDTEDKVQKTEDLRQKTEDNKQDMEFRILNSEDRSQESEDRNQDTEFRIHPECFREEERSQESEVRIQEPEFRSEETAIEMIIEEEKEQVNTFFELPVIQNYIDIENVSLVEVLFKGSRKGCYLNVHHLDLKATDIVLVEVDGGGVDYGTVSKVCKDWLDKYKENCDKEFPKYKLFRLVNHEDSYKIKKNTSDERYAVARSKDLVRKHNLDMKVTEAEWQFDRQRLTVYFTAPQRIDFRDLVKDLARTFKTRIELRQISSREEQKRVGFGMGGCGQMLCCTSFLNEFCHVTLDHARTQQLSNNVAKLSGNCGRLKCCLLFEYDNYVSAFEKYPPLDSMIKLKEGVARISKVDVFKDLIHLHIQESGKYLSITYDELTEHIKNGNLIYSERRNIPYGIDSHNHNEVI